MNIPIYIQDKMRRAAALAKSSSNLMKELEELEHGNDVVNEFVNAFKEYGYREWK